MEKSANDFSGEEAVAYEGRQGNAENSHAALMANAYTDKIKANRQLFSNDAAERYERTFKEAPYQTQLLWFYELDVIIEELRALQNKLTRLAPEENDRFARMSRHDKRASIKDLENVGASLESDFRDQLYKSKNSKHFCEKEKEQAMKAFAGTSIKRRQEMVRAVGSWLGFEAKRSAEFEALAQDLAKKDPSKIELTKKLRVNFYNAPHDKKTSIIARLRKRLMLETAEEEEDMILTSKYKALLAQHVKTGVISKTTEFRCNIWFKHQNRAEQKDAVAKFSDAVRPRVALLERFKDEISPQLQKEEETRGQDGFYALGLSGRTVRLRELLERQKTLFNAGKNLSVVAASQGAPIQKPVTDEAQRQTLRAKAMNSSSIIEKRMQFTAAMAIERTARNTESRTDKKKPARYDTAREVARSGRKLKEGNAVGFGASRVVWGCKLAPEEHSGILKAGKQLSESSDLRAEVDLALFNRDGQQVSADVMTEQIRESKKELIAEITRNITGAIRKTNPAENETDEAIAIKVQHVLELTPANDNNLKISLANAA